MKIFINPKLTIASIVVKPKITPSIKGIDFLIPWLNPEWDATTLLGPGEQLVTNINKERDKISGCIFYATGRPFSDFWDGCTNITFPSLSIDPRIRTCETTPAIFFSSKLQIPITCFPIKFSSL